MGYTINDTLLNYLINRHTAFGSLAELQAETESGYVPAVQVYNGSTGFSGEHARLVKGLTERGIKVFTGDNTL